MEDKRQTCLRGGSEEVSKRTIIYE